MNEIAPAPRAQAINPTKTVLESSTALGGGGIIGCRFDPSGRFLFAAVQDSSIRRVDLLTGESASFPHHKSWVRGIAFIPGSRPPIAETLNWEHSRSASAAVTGSSARFAPAPPLAPFTVISGDYHGKLIWWRGDRPTDSPVRSIEAHAGWIRAVAVSADRKLVASCGNDHLVKIWSATNGALLQTLKGHQSHVYNVAFHPKLNRIVSVDHKGIILDWDLATGKSVRELDAKALNKYDTTFMADIGGARGIGFDVSGQQLAISGITNVSNAFAGVGNPLVSIYDWTTGKPKVLKLKDAFQGTGWGVGIHPGNAVIAAGGGSGGRIWFWSGNSEVSTHTITVPSGARDLALSPSGTRIAVAGANGTLYVYSLS